VNWGLSLVSHAVSASNPDLFFTFLFQSLPMATVLIHLVDGSIPTFIYEAIYIAFKKKKKSSLR